jgi:CheY-like chemotaxis protein
MTSEPIQDAVSPTLLVVDDQADIRKLIRLALRRKFTIIEASNAIEAYDLIRSSRPDVMLLDVMMPGEMDGFDLCARIKQDGELASIHIVMMTALAQVADQEEGQRVGANAYFTKPFSPNALIRYLDRVVSTVSERNIT